MTVPPDRQPEREDLAVVNRRLHALIDVGLELAFERNPEPWFTSPETSRVWNAISQNGSKPSTCSSQSRAGDMVWKLDVM